MPLTGQFGGKNRPRSTETLTEELSSEANSNTPLPRQPSPVLVPESSSRNSSSEWQAILFQDNRACGRLLNPQATSTTLEPSFVRLHLVFQLWSFLPTTHTQRISLPLKQLQAGQVTSFTLFNSPQKKGKKCTTYTPAPVHTKALSQAISQQKQFIDYTASHRLRRLGGAASETAGEEQQDYNYETGDALSSGSTALTFQDIKGSNPCLVAIQFSLAVPRQQLDGQSLMMSGMAAQNIPNNVWTQQDTQQQQQPQQAARSHRGEQSKAPVEVSQQQQRSADPHASASPDLSSFHVTSLQSHSGDEACSTSVCGGHQSGRSSVGSPPNGVGFSRTHRRPDVRGAGSQRVGGPVGDKAQVLGAQGTVCAASNASQVPSPSATQESAAALSRARVETVSCEGRRSNRQLLDLSVRSEQHSKAGNRSTVEVAVLVKLKEHGGQTADAGKSLLNTEPAALVQNGKVQNGVIAYGGGLQPPTEGVRAGEEDSLHSVEAGQGRSRASMNALADCSSHTVQPLNTESQRHVAHSQSQTNEAEHAGCIASTSSTSPVASVLSSSNTTNNTSGSGPPSLAGRGSTQSEPSSHVSSSPRVHRLPDQQQHKSASHSSTGHAACSPIVTMPSEFRAQGTVQGGKGDVDGICVKVSEGEQVGNGRCSTGISTWHSVGETSSSTGQQRGEKEEAAACSTHMLSQRHSGEVPAKPSSAHTGSGGAPHTRSGTGHSHNLDATSSSVGGGRGVSGWGSQGFGNPLPSAPLSRGRGSRGSSGSLSSVGSGGKSYSHQRGQSFSPRWNAGGGGSNGGGSGRFSADEVLPAQQPYQMGNGPHAPLRKGGSQTALDTPGLSPVGHEPAATADLERFLVQVTPMINVDLTQPLEQALPSLSLEDVWRFYHDPSLHGREVYTLGGARGPSVSYFVPYLSAMQLFTPASPKDPGTNRLYVCDTEGWPKHMHLRFEHFETELPFNRAPLYDQIDLLAQQLASSSTHSPKTAPAGASGIQTPVGRQQGGPPPTSTSTNSAAADATNPTTAGRQSPGSSTLSSSPPCSSTFGSTKPDQSVPVPPAASGQGHEEQQPPPPPQAQVTTASQLPASLGAVLQENKLPAPSLLRDMRISELHPASWYAVAWYPVYRIPDAPLVVRFLTFHSFAPLVTSIQNTLAALQEGQHRPMQLLPVGVVGLKWYNMHNERWLEALHEDGPGSHVASASHPDDTSTVCGQSYGRGYGGGRGSRRHVQAQQMDIQFQAHLSELQATAERLARGHGLRLLGSMGCEELRLRHPDFEFFHSRS